jgi:hypothetical protein
LHTAGLLLVLQVALSTGGTGADEHLLAGARSFREGRFDEALVEFRVAQTLGSPDASAYAGAALVKLDRPEEAIQSFGGGDEPGRDALIDYYRALACYEARLYLCADRLLAGVGERSGPRIADQAAKIRSGIAAELAAEPSRVAVDWYLARCSERNDAKRPILVAAYCREAAGLARRRKDQYGRAEAEAMLARLGRGSRAGSRQ